MQWHCQSGGIWEIPEAVVYQGQFPPTLTLTDETIGEEATEWTGGNCQQPGHYIEDPALQGEVQPQRWPEWQAPSLWMIARQGDHPSSSCHLSSTHQAGPKSRGSWEDSLKQLTTSPLGKC